MSGEDRLKNARYVCGDVCINEGRKAAHIPDTPHDAADDDRMNAIKCMYTNEVAEVTST